MHDEIEHRRDQNREGDGHADGEQAEEDQHHDNQFDAGGHARSPLRKILALVSMVRIRAKHSSSIPIAMALCGSHSGVCSGVGATSSARHELETSRYNCQVTSADATSETRSKTICEISLAANDRCI